MTEQHKANIIKARSKPIIQFDKLGNVIAEFSSITQASKITGINQVSISRVLHGKQKLTNALYKWRYKNND